MKGRKPLPTKLHVLNGNPSKKNLDTNEPKPIPIAPQPPTWLDPVAKKLWKQLAPQLENLGLFTAIDGPAFEAVCQNYAVWVRCERYLKKNGLTFEYQTESGATYVQQRPEVAIGNKALQSFKAFCTEFGLTPSSRTRINIKPATGEEDPMEALLKRGG